MIGIDWGTSRLRAFLLDPAGSVLDRRTTPDGIGALKGAGLEQALARAVAGWPQDAKLLMCGMVGSRQGLAEAPYLACPADLSALAAALLTVRVAGRAGHIVPGLSCQRADGADVLRGEETLLLGAGLTDAVACLPGTHSKWVRVVGAAVQDFRTHLTGELFAAVAEHTIVGALIPQGVMGETGFGFHAGLDRARANPTGLTAHLFGLRAAVLTGRLAPDDMRAFLSGLLIGHEIAAEAPSGEVVLIGEGQLASSYRRALLAHGLAVREVQANAPAGLFRIARAAGLLPG
jgi:2-dehydro-3-deoxygalactonokinase